MTQPAVRPPIPAGPMRQPAITSVPPLQALSRTSFWLPALFFISGFPALIYQIVWQRALFTIYGINIESVTIVVTAFMLGLGAGSLLGGWLSRVTTVSALKVFAVLEIVIALFGLLSLPLFHWVASFTGRMSPFELGIVAFLLVVVPTMAMGATLPLLTSYLVRLSGNVGRAVGVLYFVNTLGSAVACLVAAKVTMPMLGMSGSVQLAAAINVFVGLSGLALGARLPSPPALSTPSARSLPTGRRDVALPAWIAVTLAGLCGFVALSYEIVWFRLYSFATGGQARTFPYLLGLYLLGIAVGSLAIRSVCGKSATDRAQRNLFILWSLLVAASVTAFLVGPLLVVGLRHVSVNWTMPFIVIPAALLGAAFPLICHLSIPADARSGSRVSLLYVANIAGSTAGTFLTGFVFMDLWPLVRLLVGLSLLGLAIAVLAIPSARLARMKMATMTGATAAIGCLLWLAAPSLFDRFLERLQPIKYDYVGTDRFADVIETKSGIITVTGDGTVFGGGIYDGKFNVSPVRDSNGIYRAYALGAVHAAPRRVLMIGLSTGSWAQVVANNPAVESLTVVEINPGYRSLVSRHGEVASLLANPKVDIVFDDGRRWLVRHPGEKFDVIFMNTVFNWRSNATNVLSTDFLELVRQHLAEGGIAYYNTTGSGEVAFTGTTVFPHALQIGSFLAVSDAPLAFDRERLRRDLLSYRIDGQAVLDVTRDEDRKRLEELVNMPEPAGRDAIRDRFAGSLVMTDDNMGVEWR